MKKPKGSHKFYIKFNKVSNVDLNPVIKKIRVCASTGTVIHERVNSLPSSIKIILILIGVAFLFNAKESTKTVDHRSIVEIAEHVPVKKEEVRKEIKKEVKKEGLIDINMIPVIFSKRKEKKISITEIIKDEKLIDFLCQGEVIKRAVNVGKKTGLDETTIIGMKAIESRMGQSTLCNITKNLGNVKCFNKKCKKNNVKGLRKGQRGNVGSHCVQFYDDAPSDRFVRYNTWGEGWKKWEQLMCKTYAKAGKKEGSLNQLRTIKRIGYATNPQYVSIIQGYIVKTGLQDLQKYINEGYTITTESGKYVLLQQ